MSRITIWVSRVCVLFVYIALLSLSVGVSHVMAGSGIALRPPFNGTYRLTSYFDHRYPNYHEDNQITIYTGESVSDCSPYCYHGHNGIDWSMLTGTDVLAAAAGEVEEIVDQGNLYYGCRIMLDHANGYKTMYGHIDRVNGICDFDVGVGDFVQAGTVLGDSGDTGNSSGPHLHFTVFHNSYPTDPFGWRGSEQDPLVDYSGETASCLWAGAPGDDISCGDIIVEDDGNGWSQSGWWGESGAGNGARQHWTNVWDEVSAYVRWTPPSYYPGSYQVHAFIPAANSTTNNASYEVYSYPDSEIHTINQNNPANTNFWASLGIHNLVGYDWVYLNDYTGEIQNSRQIAADAMKFSAGVVYLPDVRNASGWLSSINIRNHSITEAKVTINYYTENSAEHRTSSDKREHTIQGFVTEGVFLDKSVHADIGQ